MLELNKIYLIDCMEGMKEFPDKYFELAIVDPPYGLKRLEKGSGWLESYGDTGKWNHLKPTQEYFDELFRISENQIIWGMNNFNLPPTEYFIIWDKLQFYPNMARAELAWTNIKKPCNMYEKRFCSEPDRIHPTQKPIRLYEWLLSHYAKKGDKILDTHVGSGSSIIAFEKHGFEYCGFEIDKDYYEASMKRILKHRELLKQEVLNYE